MAFTSMQLGKSAKTARNNLQATPECRFFFSFNLLVIRKRLYAVKVEIEVDSL